LAENGPGKASFSDAILLLRLRIFCRFLSVNKMLFDNNKKSTHQKSLLRRVALNPFVLYRARTLDVGMAYNTGIGKMSTCHAIFEKEQSNSRILVPLSSTSNQCTLLVLRHSRWFLCLVPKTSIRSLCVMACRGLDSDIRGGIPFLLALLLP
jgi:hypothetical protein